MEGGGREMRWMLTPGGLNTDYIKDGEECAVCEGYTCPGLVRRLHDVETSSDPRGARPQCVMSLLATTHVCTEWDCILRPSKGFTP